MSSKAKIMDTVKTGPLTKEANWLCKYVSYWDRKTYRNIVLVTSCYQTDCVSFVNNCPN